MPRECNYVITYMSGCWVDGMICQTSVSCRSHVGEGEEFTSIIIVVVVAVVNDIIVSHIASSVKDDILSCLIPLLLTNRIAVDRISKSISLDKQRGCY